MYAHSCFGLCFAYGHGVEKNLKEAVHLIRMSAELVKESGITLSSSALQKMKTKLKHWLLKKNALSERCPWECASFSGRVRRKMLKKQQGIFPGPRILQSSRLFY